VVASLPGPKVTDIGSTARIISSSLTAVDLHGLTRLELGFAVLMVAGAAGLILGLGLAERRRTFAILSALGAKNHPLAAFLWSEGVLALVSGPLVGLVTGFGLAEMLVKVLTGVFDPPPEFLSMPLGLSDRADRGCGHFRGPRGDRSAKSRAYTGSRGAARSLAPRA
jgi:putative ABC transport system permease protein